MLHNPNLHRMAGESCGRRSYTVTEVPAEQRRSVNFPFILRVYGRSSADRMQMGEPTFVESEVRAHFAGLHWLRTGDRIAA